MAETTRNTAAETTEIVDNQTTTEVIETAKPVEETKVEETATEEAATENTTEQKVETAEPTKKTLDEILAENGYTEEIELIKTAREAKQKEVAESEKPYADTKAWAELIDFSAKNKIATESDFLQHKQLNAEKNEVLAFNKFKADYVLTEDEKDLDAEELAEVIKERFDDKFFINSDDESLKEIGQNKITDLADQQRKPINDKIATAQNRLITSAMANQHEKAVAEFNKTPQKISTEIKDAEGKVISTIEAEIMPTLDFKEITELLKSEEGTPVLNVLFEAFSKDREIGDKAFGQFLTNQYAIKNKAVEQQAIAKSSYDKGYEAGKVLAVGTKKPFNSKENTQSAAGNEPRPVYKGDY